MNIKIIADALLDIIDSELISITIDIDLQEINRTELAND